MRGTKTVDFFQLPVGFAIIRNPQSAFRLESRVGAALSEKARLKVLIGCAKGPAGVLAGLSGPPSTTFMTPSVRGILVKLE